MRSIGRHGTERWRVEAGPSWAIASAAIDGGRVIEGRSDTFYVQALDAHSGVEAWRFQTDGYVFSSAAIADGLAYVGSASGDLFALDAATGREVWRRRLGAATYASPVVSDGIVYVGSDDGRLQAFEGGPGPAPRLAVFADAEWQPRASSPKVADAVGRFFADRGYQRLDASSIARFMQDRQADRARSVVVFATDALPPALVEGEVPLLRRYLEAGGKVIWTGVPPRMLATDDAGKVIGVDRRATGVLLDVDIEGTNVDNYTIVPTRDGRAWGLRRWWMGGPGLRRGRDGRDRARARRQRHRRRVGEGIRRSAGHRLRARLGQRRRAGRGGARRHPAGGRVRHPHARLGKIETGQGPEARG